MQVTETLNEGLKRAYTITVTAAELDAKVQEKLVEAQPEIEMKGFRKGKVPMAMLRKQYGPRLLGDAMQDAIDGAMKSHFDATGDRPARSGARRPAGTNAAPTDGSDKPAEAADAPKTAVKRVRKVAAPASTGTAADGTGE